MGSLYLKTLYLHQEWVLSTDVFFTVAQTGQTKHIWVFMTTEAPTGSLSCLEGEGEVRGVQLQLATLPLDVTKF